MSLEGTQDSDQFPIFPMSPIQAVVSFPVLNPARQGCLQLIIRRHPTLQEIIGWLPSPMLSINNRPVLHISSQGPVILVNTHNLPTHHSKALFPLILLQAMLSQTRFISHNTLNRLVGTHRHKGLSQADNMVSNRLINRNSLRVHVGFEPFNL